MKRFLIYFCDDLALAAAAGVLACTPLGDRASLPAFLTAALAAALAALAAALAGAKEAIQAFSLAFSLGLLSIIDCDMPPVFILRDLQNRAILRIEIDKALESAGCNS